MFCVLKAFTNSSLTKLRSSLHLFLYTVRNTYCRLCTEQRTNTEKYVLYSWLHVPIFIPPMNVCSIRSRARCFHRKALDDVPARIAKHLGRDLHVAAPDANACLPEYKQTSLASERERERWMSMRYVPAAEWQGQWCCCNCHGCNSHKFRVESQSSQTSPRKWHDRSEDIRDGALRPFSVQCSQHPQVEGGTERRVHTSFSPPSKRRTPESDLHPLPRKEPVYSFCLVGSASEEHGTCQTSTKTSWDDRKKKAALLWDGEMQVLQWLRWLSTVPDALAPAERSSVVAWLDTAARWRGIRRPVPADAVAIHPCLALPHSGEVYCNRVIVLRGIKVRLQEELDRHVFISILWIHCNILCTENILQSLLNMMKFTERQRTHHVPCQWLIFRQGR